MSPTGSGDRGQWAAAARPAGSGVERVRGDGPAGPVRGGGRRQGRGVAGREEARRGVALRARVVPLAAVPIHVIVARVVPSPGVRSSARRLREARRADRLVGSVDVGRGAPGDVSVDADKKADQSPMSVSALDIRSPGERAG